MSVGSTPISRTHALRMAMFGQDWRLYGQGLLHLRNGYTLLS